MIPLMKKEGYDADYAVNVTTHAALVGALIEKLEKRVMACYDCHNSVGHPFTNPATIVDEEGPALTEAIARLVADRTALERCGAAARAIVLAETEVILPHALPPKLLAHAEHSSMHRVIEAAIDEYLARCRPSPVLVQGDTTTVFCAALAAFAALLPAGLINSLDGDTLAAVLKYHVVSGAVDSMTSGYKVPCVRKSI